MFVCLHVSVFACLHVCLLGYLLLVCSYPPFKGNLFLSLYYLNSSCDPQWCSGSILHPSPGRSWTPKAGKNPMELWQFHPEIWTRIPDFKVHLQDTSYSAKVLFNVHLGFVYSLLRLHVLGCLRHLWAYSGCI